MRILLVHNRYLEPGGEDTVFAAERDTLLAHGEQVATYTTDNSRIASMRRLDLARATIWNPQTRRELLELMLAERPDVVHFHNTFPLISPSGYSAARTLNVPVVQTLHNFRLLCPNALLLRAGRPCEDCLGRTVPWPGVVHRCYRQSRPATAVLAAMLAFHRRKGTWARAVDTYIALSGFSRAKFIAGGLPADRVVIQPNFLPHDPGLGHHDGGFALYVGRLSPEKGIRSLVELWRSLQPGFPLRVIGSGPLETLAADSPPDIEWLGRQPPEAVLAAMRRATMLLFPSECYENFPLVVLEAMATGLPVVGSRQGALPELLEHGVSGWLVPPGDTSAWAEAIRWGASRPGELARLGLNARRTFEKSYTADAGYRALREVYGRTLALADRVGTAPAAKA